MTPALVSIGVSRGTGFNPEAAFYVYLYREAE